VPQSSLAYVLKMQTSSSEKLVPTRLRGVTALSAVEVSPMGSTTGSNKYGERGLFV
jgi:hypothetical protein